MTQRRTMLFNRDLRSPSGGHLKFFDYLNHTMLIPSIQPFLHLTDASDLELTRKLAPCDIDIAAKPFDADTFFVAGHDWSLLDKAGIETSGKPVINLIQGVRHSFLDNPLYKFLERPALRICVSVEVAEALSKLDAVQGPIVVIENGTDLHSCATLLNSQKVRRVFIGGLKNPVLANQLANALEGDGIPTELCAKHVPRTEFLSKLANSEIAVLLPLEAEGFFLPALEAMALGTVVVTPDCIGSRQFCVHKSTCLVPKRTVDGLQSAVRFLWNNVEVKGQLRKSARSRCAAYTLENERSSFHDIVRTYLQEVL